MDSIQKGQAAKELLANPLLTGSLETISHALIEQWTISKDSEIREELWYTLAGLKRFITLLESTVENGEYELAMKGQDDE